MNAVPANLLRNWKRGKVLWWGRFVASCPFSLSLALTCLDQWHGLQRWCPCAHTTGERHNKLTGEILISCCPEFDFIVHPPRSHYTETICTTPFSHKQNRCEIKYTFINIMCMRLYEVYDILRTDMYGWFESKNWETWQLRERNRILDKSI